MENGMWKCGNVENMVEGNRVEKNRVEKNRFGGNRVVKNIGLG